MLTVDLVGLVLSMCLTGIRYPHCVLIAALANMAGQVIMAILLHCNIESIVAAGAFSSAVVDNINGFKNVLFIASGPFVNYLISRIAGGITFVSTTHLLSPTATLKHPLAVINIRFAVISILLNLCQFF